MRFFNIIKKYKCDCDYNFLLKKINWYKCDGGDIDDYYNKKLHKINQYK